MQKTERGREKSHPLWWINCKGSTCNFLSLLSPWAMGLGLDCPVLQVWGCYMAWRWVEHTNLLTKFFPFQSVEKETKETKLGPNLRGLGFADGKCFTESYNSWETGSARLDWICWITQQWVRGTLLDIGWIWCWSSYCKTLLALSRQVQNWQRLEMESPAGRRALLGT